MAEETLPGYAGLPQAITPTRYKRIGVVNATRVSGPFFVRGRNFVTEIKDGWLCEGEDGYMFGVENAVFAAQFAIVQYTITASSTGDGTIDPAGATLVDHGDELEYVVAADPGWAVDEVLVDGEPAVLTDGSYTFTNVSADHTIAVAFLD